MPENEFERELDEERVFVSGALVLATDLDTWAVIKKQVTKLGAKIIYQKLAHPGARLWIREETDRDPRDGAR